MGSDHHPTIILDALEEAMSHSKVADVLHITNVVASQDHLFHAMGPETVKKILEIPGGHL